MTFFQISQDEELDFYTDSTYTLKKIYILIVHFLCGRHIEDVVSSYQIFSIKLIDKNYGFKDENLFFFSEKSIFYEQFNEILLFFNQERMSKDFFDFLFNEKINKIDELKDGIQKFRLFAFLKFGSFRFAYKKLRKMNKDQITNYLSPFGTEPDISDYLKRPIPLKKIEKIEEQDTFLTGYISSDKIKKEYEFVRKLTKAIDGQLFEFSQLDIDYWSKFEKNILVDLAEKTENLRNKLLEVEKISEQNTDIYLTSDYLDVYVATSMRKEWDFWSTFQFTERLFSNKEIKKYNLRFFDPTQSKTGNRIDKGLVEALMLRRANFCIYMVQETDTMGKDSELAITLAQEKPVIAYVPEILDEEEYQTIISSYPLDFFQEKILFHFTEGFFTNEDIIKELKKYKITNFTRESRLYSNKEEKIKELKNNGFEDVIQIVNKFLKKINDYKNKPEALYVWKERENEVKDEDKELFSKICKIVSVTDKYFYEKRAKTLKEFHPLSIQVHLDSGVANGVFVVRNTEDCLHILLGLIKNNLKFKIKKENGVIKLLEEKTESIFRVITENRLITNTFWNFYNL